MYGRRSTSPPRARRGPDDARPLPGGQEPAGSRRHHRAPLRGNTTTISLITNITSTTTNTNNKTYPIPIAPPLRGDLHGVLPEALRQGDLL